MEPTFDLRTPSITYNHGGIYAPGDPRTCSMPNGPCSYCQARIDEEEAAMALAALATSSCQVESCPSCATKGTYVTHASKGLPTCSGCDEKFCTKCYYGSRYCCVYVYGTLTTPTGPLVRSQTFGLPSPTAEEKTENK